MSIDVILNALDNTRKVGKDKYRAPCPVHNGTDRNLMISERRDGSVGAYCFVCGANGLDVVDSLMLNKSELFPPDSDYKAPVITKQMQSEEVQDKLVIAMSQKSDNLTLADKRRIKLAEARLQGLAEIRSRAD